MPRNVGKVGLAGLGLRTFLSNVLRAAQGS